jgi:prepilin-type N-terminal cleavage/methylation domain-containing protein
MRNNEKGFSLLELSIALAIMAILTGIVAPSAISNVMETGQKTNLKADLSAVITELQSWHLMNPSTAPNATEFNDIKYRVLSDYVATPALISQNQGYLNTIQFVKIGNYYCVEGSKAFGSKTHTMHYDGLAGDAYDGACPTDKLGRPPVTSD